MKKRGFLGNTEIETQTYWTNGKGSHELKCNETNLYAMIDLCNERVEKIAKTNQEVQDQYNKMDLYYLCLKAIEQFGSDDKKLEKAGAIIGNYKLMGEFSKNYSSIDEENEHVEILINRMNEEINQNVVSLNKQFEDVYKDIVLDYNYYQTIETGKSKTLIKGLGASYYSDEDYSKKIKDGAMSMLYSVCDRDKLYDGCSNRDNMLQKIYEQENQIQWFVNAGTNMTKYSIISNIESGIIAATGKEANETLNDFKKEAVEKKGLGDPSAALTIIIIVSVAIATIVSIVTTIISIKKSKDESEALRLASEAPDIEYAAPDYSDYDLAALEAQMNQAIKNAEESGMSNLDILLIAGVGLATIIGAAAIVNINKKKQ